MSFDAHALRRQFPAFAGDGGRLHYLDNAATTQMPQAVIDALVEHDVRRRANVGRGVYARAEAATDAYEAARATVARYLGAKPAEVVFTCGATQALNLAAAGLAARLGPGDTVAVSMAEHHSALVPWLRAQEQRGFGLRPIPVLADGTIDLTGLEGILEEGCKVVAVTQCSNVTGALTDLERVVRSAHAAGALVVVDGAQAVPHGPQRLHRMGVDFYAFSGHKVYGPSGIGALWGRAELLADMAPLCAGGGMVERVSMDQATFLDPPHRFEAGTPPITQAVGLAAALAWSEGLDRTAANDHMRTLTAEAISGLATVPGLRIIGPHAGDDRVGVISFVLDGAHPHDIAQVLDEGDVAVRGGHHCAQPLMDALGIEATTRASLAPYNTFDDIAALVGAVARAARILR